MVLSSPYHQAGRQTDRQAMQAVRQAWGAGQKDGWLVGWLYCSAHLVLCLHPGTKFQETLRTLHC